MRRGVGAGIWPGGWAKVLRRWLVRAGERVLSGKAGWRWSGWAAMGLAAGAVLASAVARRRSEARLCRAACGKTGSLPRPYTSCRRARDHVKRGSLRFGGLTRTGGWWCAGTHPGKVSAAWRWKVGDSSGRIGGARAVAVHGRRARRERVERCAPALRAPRSANAAGRGSPIRGPRPRWGAGSPGVERSGARACGARVRSVGRRSQRGRRREPGRPAEAGPGPLTAA